MVEKTVTAKALAKRLGLTEVTIYGHIYRGNLMAQRTSKGRRDIWTIYKRDADEFIKWHQSERRQKMTCSRCEQDGCGDEPCPACERMRSLAEAKHWRSQGNATHVVAISERLTLRPIVAERMEEIALLGLLQVYAVAQLSERPIVPMKELGEFMVTLGVIQNASDALKLLKTAEDSGWLETIYQRHGDSGDVDLACETASDVAARTGINAKTVSAMCRRGEIEGATKIGEGKKAKWYVPFGWEPEQ